MGEATGGGQLHGALANMCDIARPIGAQPGQEETINLFLEDSKTGFSRDVTFVGKTLGPLALNTAGNLRSLWHLSGFVTRTITRDGLLVESPDYEVIRVSLVDMSPKRHTRLSNLIQGASEFWKDARWILRYLRDNYRSETLGEEFRFVNIAGGSAKSPALKKIWSWLERVGFSRFAKQVPGPLLRATANGESDYFTHMPIKPGSTYAHLPKALTMAYEMNKAKGIVDTEIDLEGRDFPLFGHHADRRKADKVARDTMGLTGVTEGEIDDHFGWDQKSRRKKSQLHYHGKDDRIKRSRVTMML